MSIKKDITNQRNHFALKNLSGQSYGFSSSYVQMWELEYKEDRALNNWCFWTVVLETLKSPLDCQEIKPVNPKRNHWKGWCWSWSSNTLATWYEEPTHWKNTKQNETLMLGKIEGRRRRRQQRMRWLVLTQWTWVWTNSDDGEGQRAWRASVHGVSKSWSQRLSNWTTIFNKFLL